MTDTNFKKLIKRTFDANIKHQKLLAELEEEYHRRYGVYPSDIDDDFFIDSFCLGQGKTCPTLEEIYESATLCYEHAEDMGKDDY